MNQAAYRQVLHLLNAAPSALDRLDWPLAQQRGVQIWVKRDDLLDPDISGNKWRKLLPQVAWRLRAGARGFASVGGPHSNHLVALAALGYRLGVPTLGLVRAYDAEGLHPPEGSPSENSASLPDALSFAKRKGMALRPVSRTELRQWRGEEQLIPPGRLEGLDYIPEGGASRLGLLGMRHLHREILSQLGASPTAYVLPAGTGTSAVGLARASSSTVHAVMCVRDAGMAKRSERLWPNPGHLHWHEGALGGFASGEPVLWSLLQRFEQAQGLRLDPIYGAKAMRWLEQELLDGQRFGPGSNIVFVHTGGLQGRPAWEARYGFVQPAME